MAKFDSEDLLDVVKSVMVTGDALNLKIATIEAEKLAKGKQLAADLKTVGAGSYYEQTWTNKILNTNPSIFYGIEDVTTTNNDFTTAQTYKVFVDLVLIDVGLMNDSNKRLARYSRALKELFEENFDAALGFGKIKVETVRPIAFRLELDKDNEVKVGGVMLSIDLV